MISLISFSYRPGSIDLLAASVVDSPGDFELVMVDDYPGRVERGEARELLERTGRLGWYGPSKPKSYPQTFCGLANAMNTALLHCRGDYIVSMTDYMTLPQDWCMAWETTRKRYPKKTLISGGGMVFSAPKPDADSDVYTWKVLPTLLPLWPWVAREFETFYFGSPIKFFEEINGIDERSDYCHCWSLASKIFQARKLGYDLAVEPQVSCCLVEHQAWDNPEEPNPVGAEGLWKLSGISFIPQEPRWTVPSPNPYSFKEMRDQYLCSLEKVHDG